MAAATAERGTTPAPQGTTAPNADAGSGGKAAEPAQSQTSTRIAGRATFMTAPEVAPRTIDLRALGEGLGAPPDEVANDQDSEGNGPEGENSTNDNPETSGDTSEDGTAEGTDQDETGQPTRKGAVEPDGGWALAILAAPQRITEIPGADRGRVIQEIVAMKDHEVATERLRAEGLATERARAAKESFEDGVREATARYEMATEVARLDELKAADRDAFVDWQDADPAGARVYAAWKAGEFENRRLTAPPKTDTPAPESSPQQVIAKATTQLAKLDAFPGARERFAAAAAKRGGYPSTQDGLVDLVADVARLVAAEEAAGTQRANATERTATAAQEAAQRLAETPKPKPRPGIPTDSGLLTEDEIDAMSATQALAQKDLVERSMAAINRAKGLTA